MTLNGHYALCFNIISVFAEPITKIRMEVDLHYQGDDVGNDSSFWQYKVYADIRGSSLERASNDSGVVENDNFQYFRSLLLQML